MSSTFTLDDDQRVARIDLPLGFAVAFGYQLPHFRGVAGRHVIFNREPIIPAVALAFPPPRLIGLPDKWVPTMEDIAHGGYVRPIQSMKSSQDRDVRVA